MEFHIVKIGKPAHEEYEPLVSRLISRLTSQYRIKQHILRENKWKNEKLLMSQPGRFLILMEDTAKQLTSEGFSLKIKSWMESPEIKQLVFFIGGPYGIPEELQARKKMSLGLSQSTLTSDLAWLVLTEQIYRALMIIEGRPYHH